MSFFTVKEIFRSCFYFVCLLYFPYEFLFAKIKSINPISNTCVLFLICKLFHMEYMYFLMFKIQTVAAFDKVDVFFSFHTLHFLSQHSFYCISFNSNSNETHRNILHRNSHFFSLEHQRNLIFKFFIRLK